MSTLRNRAVDAITQSATMAGRLVARSFEDSKKAADANFQKISAGIIVAFVLISLFTIVVPITIIVCLVKRRKRAQIANAAAISGTYQYNGNTGAYYNGPYTAIPNAGEPTAPPPGYTSTMAYSNNMYAPPPPRDVEGGAGLGQPKPAGTNFGASAEPHRPTGQVPV